MNASSLGRFAWSLGADSRRCQIGAIGTKELPEFGPPVRLIETGRPKTAQNCAKAFTAIADADKTNSLSLTPSGGPWGVFLAAISIKPLLPRVLCIEPDC